MSSTISGADPSAATLQRLNRAVLIAAGSAALIATMMVLPAEYGIDPTGVGRLLGLTQMGEMKSAQAGGGTAPAGPVMGDSVTDTPDGGKRVQIVIGPYGGREAKAVMKAGADMTYDWSTDGAAVDYEFHGDPDVPKSPGDYTSYEKGKKASAKGSFKAGFAGHHGWFWKNLTARPVVVTAIVKGGVATFEPIYAKGESATTAAVATTPAGSAAVDATPYDMNMPLKQFMGDVMSHSANEIWKRQGYISDDKGVRSLFPKNDAEWKEAENASLTLAELTNVLLIPGRRVDEQPWTDGVAAVRASALKLATLARKKDEGGYMVAGSELNEACYACHKRYAPGVD